MLKTISHDIAKDRRRTSRRLLSAAFLTCVRFACKAGDFAFAANSLRQPSRERRGIALSRKKNHCDEEEAVMRKKVVCLLLILACAAALLSGCAFEGTRREKSAKAHEPVTMQSPFRNMSAFIDVVHEKYPEICIEVIPYSGKNYTAYVQAQLRVGDMPDIYCTTYYQPGRDRMDDKLIDLSGYAFTDNYSEARLREVADNGAIYLLPTYYVCFGVTYNKTLLEKNGWTLPESFTELEELAPKVKAAGYNLALAQIQLPGYGFQYLCNILDAGFLNTPDGRRWQNAFLDGEATVADTPQMQEALDELEKWREIGMLTPGDKISDEDTRLEMAKGNTLFLLGSGNVFSPDETTDEFGLMPYLSEDGTKNAFILHVSRFMGLNRHLLDEGNEQKLEDALHIMEVLSTVEGMRALNSEYENTSLLPLKGYQVAPEGYYADIEDQLNAGATAPFIYSGWENMVVPIGTAMISYICGEAALEDVAAAIDDGQRLLTDNSAAILTTVTEKLDASDCAKLVGVCFSKAVGADMALISRNKWYKLPGDGDLNLDGVSGALYPLPMTEQEVVSILPTGWRQTIKTVALTGKRVKELAETGYDRNGDGNTFPYELVAPDGFSIDDDTVYTVVIAGATRAVQEGKLTDTGVVGLDAAKEFFASFETLSKKDVHWD